MRTSTSPQSSSRRCSRVLLLMALCALFAVASGWALAPQAPSVAVQAAPTVAEFLSALSGPGELPGSGLLPPAPKLLSTICHTDADCGRNELCCYPCGVPDCNFVCMKVKTCPPFS
jgi:hypothetical protein